MIRKVHVVFKTHLDIGFTDLAKNVIDQYMNQYIPKAITLAEELHSKGRKENFLWTTGSWLIHYYLKNATVSDQDRMKQAIRNGYITWHGLPFTTHTELLNADLLEYGLSISDKLDDQFNKTTISAKMTDVPGHTISMVPYLAQHGIKYLHIGVNPASHVPEIPKLFRWRAGCGSEIIVNYASSYGEFVEIDGLEDVMVFAHTGDNCGPSSPAEIQDCFHELEKQFPNAEIQASTMDEFAHKVLEIKDKLPVVTEEIGDTWIHGTGTDPYKLAYYRGFNRLRSKWLKNGTLTKNSDEYEMISENLALVAEHTWGMDLKKYLPDFTNYSKNDFRKARKENYFDEQMMTSKYQYIGSFALDEMDENSKVLFNKENPTYSYELFESSWKEQRAYLDKALQSLDYSKKEEVEKMLTELTSQPKLFKNGKGLHLQKMYKLGKFQVAFDINGAISYLQDDKRKIWADEHHQLGLFNYETFGPEDYNYWFKHYMRNLKSTHVWADADYGKPGFEYAEPKPKHKLFNPSVMSIQVEKKNDVDSVCVTLNLPDTAVEFSGAPKELILKYQFHKEQSSIDISLFWSQKEAVRLPEASWFSFIPIVDNPNLWMLNKLGSNISPLQVVKGGNRNLHAVDQGMLYEGADGRIKIETLDAALVSPGEKKLLQFDNEIANLNGGMHVNLHNNIWGTNFPMWYEDNAKFRFRLMFEANTI
ncbi:MULTISPECIES: DUF5054 domain-containing protein [Gracilibacillus]|uniref:DUF5054 domain-containing protein n=1 Tax=Gracilibacillus TaxID=74385 RepID=UPI000824778C|nr:MULTISPECIES: DUF5054 domain-containing protein [Gracilibacillus]